MICTKKESNKLKEYYEEIIEENFKPVECTISLKGCGMGKNTKKAFIEGLSNGKYKLEDDQNLYLKEYEYSSVSDEHISIDFYANQDKKIIRSHQIIRKKTYRWNKILKSAQSK